MATALRETGESRRAWKEKWEVNFPLALGGLVAGAILLRIGLVLVLPRVAVGDEVTYLLLGRHLVTGRGFTLGMYPEVIFPPLYPMVAGAGYWLLGDLEWASNAAYALCGGLLLLPVFIMARRIYGAQTAWLAALLLAIFPALSVSVLYPPWGTMSEPLYLALLYGGLAALLVGFEDRRSRLVTAAGGLFGLAYLTRPEAIVYFGVFLGVGLVNLARGLHWRAIAGYIVAFGLLAAPYVWYLHAQTGQWMLSGKLALTWEWGDWAGGHKSGADLDRSLASLDSTGRRTMWDSPERFQRSMWQNVWADPKGFLRRVQANVRVLRQELFDREAFWYGLLPFVVVALFNQPWDLRRLSHEAFLMAALVPLLAFLAFHIEVRFLAPAFPVLLLWTARGALGLGRWLQESLARIRGRWVVSRRVQGLLAWVPTGLVVLLFLVTGVSVARLGAARTPLSYKEVALWIRAHTSPEARIMTRGTPGSTIVLYANRDRISFPHTDWPHLLEFARAYGATHWVTADWELTGVRPQLAFLIEPGALPPELELLSSFEDRQGHILVYRLLH